MAVISKAVLKEFAEKYPEAEAALMKWYIETQAADWKNFSEVKRPSIQPMLWQMTGIFLI